MIRALGINGHMPDKSTPYFESYTESYMDQDLLPRLNDSLVTYLQKLQRIKKADSPERILIVSHMRYICNRPDIPSEYQEDVLQFMNNIIAAYDKYCSGRKKKKKSKSVAESSGGGKRKKRTINYNE